MCKCCNFVTDKSYNLRRHKSSLKHLRTVDSIKDSYLNDDDKYICQVMVNNNKTFNDALNTPTIELENLIIKPKQQLTKVYICDCGKECNSRQSLHYHKSICYNQNTTLVDEILELEQDENYNETLKTKLVQLKDKENKLLKKRKRFD